MGVIIRQLGEKLSHGVANSLRVAVDQVLWIDVHAVRTGIREFNARPTSPQSLLQEIPRQARPFAKRHS